LVFYAVKRARYVTNITVIISFDKIRGIETREMKRRKECPRIR